MLRRRQQAISVASCTHVMMANFVCPLGQAMMPMCLVKQQPRWCHEGNFYM